LPGTAPTGPPRRTSRHQAVIDLRDSEGEADQLEADQLRRQLTVAEHMGDLLGHELRQVAVVLGAHASLLEQSWTELPVDQRGECITTIREQTDRLSRLVTDLLDLSRPAEFISPEVAVRSAVEEAAALAAGSRALGPGAVLVRCPPALRARANPSLIVLVVRNLVENALVHGRPPVTVTVEADDHRLVLRVEDDGPGVDREFVTDLFEWSRQSDPHGSGFGLGLAIIHDVVTLHGGQLSFAPREERGAAFTVELALD